MEKEQNNTLKRPPGNKRNSRWVFYGFTKHISNRGHHYGFYFTSSYRRDIYVCFGLRWSKNRRPVAKENVV